MSDIRYEFILSQIKHIRDIKDDEKTKISLVYYEGCQGTCIFKICKNRNLLEIYQALMEVRHPNLARVYDCVYENGNTYVVEEYIPGKTLAKLLEENGTFSDDETARIIIELCGGLEVLHCQEPPMIHNDIKASNIMIKEDGTVKLFDFDISRTYKEGAYKNTKLMGTYEYAAPEHYGFGQSEPCTDIYSLGVTMHEMLTGVGLDQEHNVTYQGGLAKIIQKCVEIDRKKRYASAALLKADLEKYQSPKAHLFRVTLICICVAILLSVGGIFLNDYLGRGNNPKDTMETEGHSSEDVSKESQNIETEGNNSEEDESIGTEENTSQEDESIGTEGNDSEGNFGEDENVGTEGSNSEEGSKEDENIGTEDNVGSSSTENSEAINNNTGTNNNAGNETNTETNNNETSIPKKPMKTIYNVQGTLLGLDAWKDGTTLWLEEVSGKYYLGSSDGKEKLLGGVNASLGVDLACDPYTDKMYLLLSHYDGNFIYFVNKELEIELFAKLNYGDGNGGSLAFLSDGTLVYGSFLVDGTDGAKIGNLISGSYPKNCLVNDKMFALVEENDGSSAFLELDANGAFVKEYALEDDISVIDSLGEKLIYDNGKSVYFFASKGGGEYVYYFDGETYEVVACLNDYERATYFNYGYLYVSDTAFGCYNYQTKAIIEFSLE